MSYTVDTVPHLRCGQCKCFDIRADQDGHESSCKRIDHKKVQFFKSPFKSYHCGEWHIPCSDFEPMHPEYADFRDWEGMEDAWPVFRDAWAKNAPSMLTFHVNKNYDVDYLVPFERYYDGNMIKDGVLMAEYKQTCVKDKVDLGVQLYKIRKEKINGVVIETGEEL